MNWEAAGAIGEIVGAFAVLMTLIYIAVQVRRTQEIAIAQSNDNSQQINLQQSAMWIENMDLVQKANAEEPLSEKEAMIFTELVQTRGVNAFLLYVRLKRLGVDEKYAASNFAAFLCQNRGARSWWQERESDRQHKGSFLNPVRKEFSDDVEELIQKFEKDSWFGA